MKTLPSPPSLFVAPLLVCVLAQAGCSSKPAEKSTSTTMQEQVKSAAPASVTLATPRIGEAVRVGGDLTVQTTGEDGDYRSGNCQIDTPLPEGYPLPTPPGAIEIKTYPSVRLAEVAGTGDPDDGMNKTFWPLFNHIKSHDIAMTSPVEMNYKSLKSSEPSKPESWSMAFLYRRAEQNETGKEGKVVVRDAGQVTVLAIGMKGNYSMELVQSGMTQIEDFLAKNPQWEAAGEWRSLYYNGPALLFWNKWAEVQLPVRLKSQAAVSSSDAGAMR